MGTTGLETAFAALHTELVVPGVLAARAGRREALRGRRAVRPAAAADRGRRAGRPLPRRPRRGVEGRRGRLREPLGELLLRRAHAARPGLAHGRRRRRRLPGADVRPESQLDRLRAPRGRHALRRRGASAAPRPGHRRGRLHDRHVRLPGVDHRPVASRASSSPSPTRTSATTASRAAAMESDGVHARAAIMRAAVNHEDAPGAERGWLDWLRGLRRPGDHRRRHARARAPHPRRGRDARRVFPGDMREAEARERDRRRAAHGRPRPRARGHARRGADVSRTATGDGPRIVALDTGIKRSIVRNFTSRGATLELYPCTTTGRRAARRRPGRVLPRQRPGRPGGARLRRRHDPRAARQRSRCSASASATSCSAAPSAWRPSSCPFGHRGANHPVKDLRDGADRDHVARTTASRSAASPARACRRTSARPSSPT